MEGMPDTGEKLRELPLPHNPAETGNDKGSSMYDHLDLHAQLRQTAESSGISLQDGTPNHFFTFAF
jgi:hypothetical protein